MTRSIIYEHRRTIFNDELKFPKTEAREAASEGHARGAPRDGRRLRPRCLSGACGTGSRRVREDEGARGL